jgi:hypothetical protein
LTVCAAFALTGCSVIEGVFGHGGKELTKATVASMEYVNDWAQPLTVEKEETLYEDGKELKNTEKYIVVGTTVEYTYTDQYLNADNAVATGDTITSLYYARASSIPEYPPYMTLIYRENNGEWINGLPPAKAQNVFSSSNLFSNIRYIDFEDIVVYAKYFKKNGDVYTLGHAEAETAYKDLKKKGDEYYPSEIIKYMNSNKVLTVTLKDGKLFEVTETSEVYTIVNGVQTKQTPTTKTTYTYGGSVTIPTF